MTKKDFELIASVIKNADEVADKETREALAEMFAEALAGTNDRFNAETFLKFCGVK